MKLWIVTVNFGDISSTQSLIDSVENLDQFNSIKIGIADNSSSHESSYQLKNLQIFQQFF